MKHYVIESRFERPITEFRDAVPDHRAYLQKLYEAGSLLFSGPKTSRDGEVFVARAESDEQIEALIKDEPYSKQGFAKYTVVGFTPTMKNPALDHWN